MQSCIVAVLKLELTVCVGAKPTQIVSLTRNFKPVDYLLSLLPFLLPQFCCCAADDVNVYADVDVDFNANVDVDVDAAATNAFTTH